MGCSNVLSGGAEGFITCVNFFLEAVVLYRARRTPESDKFAEVCFCEKLLTTIECFHLGLGQV